ncbi:MAG: hypothetical protein ABH868_02335 [bacterium]
MKKKKVYEKPKISVKKLSKFFLACYKNTGICGQGYTAGTSPGPGCPT